MPAAPQMWRPDLARASVSSTAPVSPSGQKGSRSWEDAVAEIIEVPAEHSLEEAVKGAEVFEAAQLEPTG